MEAAVHITIPSSKRRSSHKSFKIVITSFDLLMYSRKFLLRRFRECIITVAVSMIPRLAADKRSVRMSNFRFLRQLCRNRAGFSHCRSDIKGGMLSFYYGKYTGIKRGVLL